MFVHISRWYYFCFTVYRVCLLYYSSSLTLHVFTCNLVCNKLCIQNWFWSNIIRILCACARRRTNLWWCSTLLCFGAKVRNGFEILIRCIDVQRYCWDLYCVFKSMCLWICRKHLFFNVKPSLAISIQNGARKL